MDHELTIRDVRPEDAERLAAIYAPYVLETAVTFEYAVPTAEEFEARIRRTQARFPYLACEDGGRVIGYAYATPFSAREAYAWTVMPSIYVDRACRRRGTGARLYEALEERLRRQGIVNLLAAVAYIREPDEHLSPDSYLFHLKAGYAETALLKGVGLKFGRWYDLMWMQKKLV